STGSRSGTDGTGTPGPIPQAPGAIPGRSPCRWRGSWGWRRGERCTQPRSYWVELQLMNTAIRRTDLTDSIAAALQYISYYHPADYIRHLARAYEREQSPAAKDAIAQILTNSRMCAEGRRPICQDTGIVNVFLKVGMDVRWEGFDGTSIADAVNAGVRKAY